MLKTVGIFARHLRGKGWLITALFLLGLASAAASLATPLIGKAFIDAVAGRGDYSVVPRIAAALLGLALADLVLGGVTRLAHAKLSADVLVGIRQRLFAHCLKAPLEVLERFRHGDLLTRFGADISKIQSLLVDGLLGLVQNIIFLVVAAFILLGLSKTLAFWSFIGLVLALAVTAAFRRPVESGTRGIREAMVGLSHFLSERLAALRAVRLHAAQVQEAQCFAGQNAGLVRKMLRFQVLDVAASGLPSLMLSASLAWIYLLGGGLLESGEISLGTFVAFILYQGRLYGPARGLLGLVRNLQEVRVSLERVADVLAGEEGTAGPSMPETGGEEAVVFAGVSFAYPETSLVLRRLDLNVALGERVAIFGTSGGGKSTLVQMLFGLRSPQEGEVRLGNGLRLGYAGSDPFLLHGTVEENLRYGNPEGTHGAMVESACLAEAHTFITGLPQGYDTVIGGRGLALSDGQRQRLGLARLILAHPDVLILDEALSALDPETEARVRCNLQLALAGRTLIVISHRLEGLEEYDRLLLLEKGQLRQVDEAGLINTLGAMASLDPAVRQKKEEQKNYQEEADADAGSGVAWTIRNHRKGPQRGEGLSAGLDSSGGDCLPH